MWKKLRGILRRRLVTRIVCICAVASSAMILVQAVVIGAFFVQNQERQAIDTSSQVLSAAEDYFAGIYDKLKSVNAQLYKDHLVRQQVQEFVSEGAEASPGDRIRFQSLLHEQLVKEFGSDFDALIEANYYDLTTGVTIGFYWTDAVLDMKPYAGAAVQSALQVLEQDTSLQRIYELAVVADNAGESTLTLFDFVRDPKDLTKIAGVMMFHYSMEQITQRLARMGFSDDMEVILVSQNGSLCYDTFHDYRRASAVLEHISLTPGVYTQDGVCVVRYNTRFGFSVVSTIGHDALYGSIYQMSLFVILCTISVLAVLLVLLLVYARRISGRMRALADEISLIEAGRLDVVLPETGNRDEVDQLAHNLNEMQTRLAEQLEREKQSRERASQLELMQKDAEFYALQAQIKPHFLFNTLEVIRMRAVVEHAVDTAVMVRLLADIFRENVSRQTLTTVAETVNYCEKYVELFSYRFNGELVYDVHVNPAARRYVVPTYVLQPILENALIHGLQADTENPCLVIAVEMDGGVISMRVSDNGCGMDAETVRRILRGTPANSGKSSIGIANVNHRIQMLFGTAYGLQIESEPGNGTTVTVRFPAVTKLEEWRSDV